MDAAGPRVHGSCCDLAGKGARIRQEHLQGGCKRIEVLSINLLRADYNYYVVGLDRSRTRPRSLPPVSIIVLQYMYSAGAWKTMQKVRSRRLVLEGKSRLCLTTPNDGGEGGPDAAPR